MNRHIFLAIVMVICIASNLYIYTIRGGAMPLIALTICVVALVMQLKQGGVL